MNDNDMAITLVQRGSREWDFMWSSLGKDTINRKLSQPTVAENFGEVWQYMETREVRSLFGKRYFHFFRHRLHPTKGPYGIKIPASRNFDSTNLVKSFTP
ncbi:hypothetical protein ACIPUN_02055 [Pectobacterium sp. CHL-2024]|uniref:hypothetical protein n=1 Tax=Pectobacterium sp. CHL-2024 TaxID=3377079 RepID=UPI003805A700